MTNYENFIIEMLTELDVVKHQEEIKEHINWAYCLDKLNGKKREMYLQYLQSCVFEIEEKQNEAMKARWKAIEQEQAVLQLRREYKEACKLLFSSARKV